MERHAVADAIRQTVLSVEDAIETGHRSRSIDAHDLVEVLLSIADQLDPPGPTPGRATRRRKTR